MRDRAERGFPLWPWMLLLAWVAVIWGHSLMPGSESSSESGRVVQLVQHLIYHFGLQDNYYAARLLADPDLLHHIVRKTAHFSEYFVLGALSFNALRLTFSNPMTGSLALVVLWVSVPSIDEWIQRFVPERAGRLADVMLDMSGFACSFVICLLIALVRKRRR